MTEKTKNPNMKGGGGLQKQIITMMGETAKRTELWTVADVVESTGLTKLQADNAMANAWRSGKIYRHKINDNPEGNFGGSTRYALEIKEKDRMAYSPTPISNSGPRTYKARKIQKASSKEIRTAFMEMQRAFTRLEDIVMPVIESAEEKDKALERLKNIM